MGCHHLTKTLTIFELNFYKVEIPTRAHTHTRLTTHIDPWPMQDYAIKHVAMGLVVDDTTLDDEPWTPWEDVNDTERLKVSGGSVGFRVAFGV